MNLKSKGVRWKKNGNGKIGLKRPMAPNYKKSLNNYYEKKGLKDMIEKDTINSGTLVHEKANLRSMLGFDTLKPSRIDISRKLTRDEKTIKRAKEFLRENRK